MTKERFFNQEYPALGFPSPEKTNSVLVELLSKKQKLIDSGVDLREKPKSRLDGAIINAPLIQELTEINGFLSIFSKDSLLKIKFDDEGCFSVGIQMYGDHNELGFRYSSRDIEKRSRISPVKVDTKLIKGLFGDPDYRTEELGLDQASIGQLGRLTREEVFAKFETAIKS